MGSTHGVPNERQTRWWFTSRTTAMIAGICLAAIFLAECNANQAKQDPDQMSMLFLLWFLSQKPPTDNEEIADIYFERGFPGTTNSISDGAFSGVAGDFTITVGGVTATGISLPGGNSLQFTMPTLSDITDNKNVVLTVTKSGATVFSKTIRYRPVPSLGFGAPNGTNRPISPNDKSVFFTVTVAGAGEHLFNVFGYGGANLDLYYYSSPVSAPTTIAEGTASNIEFKKVNIGAPGTYYFQIKHVSGPRVWFKTNIADGEITPASTSNGINDGSFLCYDRQSTGTASNAASGCTTVNGTGSRSGRCTYVTGSGGINTRHYYIGGFSTNYAQDTCLIAGNGSENEAEAIFQAN